jgi:hypothetical protein
MRSIRRATEMASRPYHWNATGQLPCRFLYLEEGRVAERWEFDITGCRFAQFFRELGEPELGSRSFVLSTIQQLMKSVMAKWHSGALRQLCKVATTVRRCQLR